MSRLPASEILHNDIAVILVIIIYVAQILLELDKFQFYGMTTRGLACLVGGTAKDKGVERRVDG